MGRLNGGGPPPGSLAIAAAAAAEVVVEVEQVVRGRSRGGGRDGMDI